MQDYLKGYLQVLPDYQRRKIEDIVKENQELFNISSLSQQEFAEVMSRLAEDHNQLTIFIPQGEKLDDELYNSFFSNVHVDLNMMFMESQMIESATMNYERIFDGIISDLEKELKTLRNRVNGLRLVSEGEDGLILKQYSFDDKSQMETNREKYSHLFQDRDGSMITSDVVIERTHDQHFIALAKTQEVDCLHNEKGETTATIKIVDRRGRPVEIAASKTTYKLENAIDGSPDSYWAEMILVDEPIQTEMKK